MQDARRNQPARVGMDSSQARQQYQDLLDKRAQELEAKRAELQRLDLELREAEDFRAGLVRELAELQRSKVRKGA